MQKIFKYLAFICAFVFALVSCERQDIQFYTGENSVYFDWAKTGKLVKGAIAGTVLDSVDITFFYGKNTQLDTIIEVPIKVQGNPSNQDREVAFVVNTASTATKGVHYELPEKITIPANEVVGYLPVTFYRTADLKTNRYSVIIDLVENQNFNTNITTKVNAANATPLRVVSLKQLQLYVFDYLAEPLGWNKFYYNYLGTFSEKKVKLFAEVNGIEIPDFNLIPYSRFSGQVSVLKYYLDKQEEYGTPVLEEDGTKMVLGIYAK